MNLNSLNNLFNYSNNSQGIYNDIYSNNHHSNNNQRTNSLNNELI
jgi:hypothetical protein